MPTDVRILQETDRAVLSNVAADVFDDPIDGAACREFLGDPRHRLAVAIDAGVVVGFASGVICLHPDKPRPELWINEVGVASSHRGQGIGRRLIEVMLDAGRAAQCRDAWVLTDRSNDAAMRLYAAAGGEGSSDHVMFTFSLD
jgi:aminoglycoside 6'-N-acetyltransferase I